MEFVTLSQPDPRYSNMYFTCKLSTNFSNHLTGMIGSCLFESSDYAFYNCEVDLIEMESLTFDFVMLKAELRLMSGCQNKNHIFSAKLVEDLQPFHIV